MTLYKISYNYDYPRSFGIFLKEEHVKYWNAIQNPEGDDIVIARCAVYREPFVVARVNLDTSIIDYWDNQVYRSAAKYPRFQQKGPKTYLYVAVPLGPVEQMIEEIKTITKTWTKENFVELDVKNSPGPDSVSAQAMLS